MSPSNVVLLVQANASSAPTLCAELARANPFASKLECAETLDAALEILARQRVAAILLDLDLPNNYQWDAFITLHLRAPETPILVFAENVSLELGREAMRAGAQDCLTRAQIESPQILHALAYAMERQQLQSETHLHAEQLQFSEARFRLLINDNADAIVVVNGANILRFANPAAAVLFGKTREELVGSSFPITLTDEMQTVEFAHARVQVRSVETLWNGEQVWLATLRDVTAQYEMADALQTSQARYREFINMSADGIWRAEFSAPLALALPEDVQVQAIFEDAHVVECNDALAQMYGFTHAAEMLGRVVSMEVLADDVVNQELYRDFLQNGYRIENRVTHERDRFGNPKEFLNNMYGIVRGDFMLGMWGARRDVTAEAQKDAAHPQFRELHQRKMAQALADSAMVLNSTLSFEQVLDRILENVGRVVPHDAASVFLIEDGVGRFVRGKGFVERGLGELMESLRVRVNENPAYQWMATTGKPMFIPDTSLYDGWRTLTGSWIKSYVGAPLRVQDEIIGFLSLDSATRNYFTSQNVLDLQAFAAQAATALENARLHDDVNQRAKTFETLFEFTRELALQRDLDALLEMIVDLAMRLLSASCGSLAFYHADEQMLEPRLVRGVPNPIPTAKLAVGEGLVGQVALTRAPIVISDYRAWDFRSSHFARSEITAAVSVPMLYGGELIGVLTVHEWGEPTRQFTHADAQLLSLLATQAAGLLHNARLNDETERRAQQLALLYDAGLTLNSVLHPRTQLDFLAQIAMRSVHAEVAVFFRFEEKTRELVFDVGIGFDNNRPYYYEQRVALDAPQGIEAWVGRERVPAILPDTRLDARYAPSKDPVLSGIWVPVEHDKRLLGVLAVASSKQNAFTPYDERLLLLYASQAAVAMENARLYQDALRANERRGILHWASQEIIRAGLDAERVYEAIHQASARLMPCESFVIAVYDEKEQVIQLPYLFDRGGRQPSAKQAKTRGLSGRVLASGESILVGDLAASGLDFINYGYPMQVSSVIAVPLRHGGQVFGMLSVQAYEQDAYSQDDRVMLEMLAAHAAASLTNVKSAETMLESLERAYLETALALAKAIDLRDTYTGAHSDRITDYADAVARKLNLSQEERSALRLGARLHDIGKIGVPDTILLKPGALDDKEWAMMRRHPEIGAEILESVRPLQNVIPIVKHHQERFDGTGYPDGLAGDEIPFGARILAVVDAFSAMTDDRTYRKGRSVTEAIAELEQYAGTQFDPLVVNAFLQTLAET